MRKRFTTRAQDAAFILERMADAHRAWKVGDACMSYKLAERTTVAAINGERVTLANGEVFHISHMRRVR